MKINKRNAPVFCTSRHGRGKWSTLMFCGGSTYTVICSPIKTTKEIYWCPRPNNISIPIESRQQLILGDPEGQKLAGGGRGQRNRKAIEPGATRNRLQGRVPFLSSPYAFVRIVPIGSECSTVNQIFGNLPWESSKWLNKSSPLNKIKIPKKRWPERCRSWLFDGKTGQLYWSLNRKWSFIKSSSTERCHGNFVNRFWQEHDLYFLRYGKRRNALIENLYKLNFPSKKCYRRPDILGDCGPWIAHCRRKTHSIILHSWFSLSLSTTQIWRSPYP